MTPKKRARNGSVHRMARAASAALCESPGVRSSIEEGRRALYSTLFVQMDEFLDPGEVLTVLVANLPEVHLIEQ